jgi:hypothetical protein
MSGETGGTLLEAAAKAEIVIEERQGLSEPGATDLVRQSSSRAHQGVTSPMDGMSSLHSILSGAIGSIDAT